MATKVNADHLQKLSTTHKNVSTSVKTNTSKAQATTAKLKLDTSRNPAVKAVPARTQAVVQRVVTKTATIGNRSTELAKRADYVREQAAKESYVKAPTKAVAMPATTASANNARSSAAKLSFAAKARTVAPTVKPQPRRPTVLRPLPKPAAKPEPLDTIKPFERDAMVGTLRRVEVLKGAGGKVRVYRSSATRTRVGNTIQATTTTTTKPGPRDNPVEKTSPLSASAVFVDRQVFRGVTGTVTRGRSSLTGTAGAYANANLAIKRSAGNVELVGGVNAGITARATAKTGVRIGQAKAEASVTAAVGINGSAEVALSAGRNGVTAKGKASVFAGAEVVGDGTVDFWGGIIKVTATGAARAGLGAEIEGEASITANRIKLQGGAGVTALLGGRVAGSIEVDVPKASKAVQKGADNMSRAITGQDVATNIRQTNRNLAWAVRNPSQAATAIGRGAVAVTTRSVTAVATSRPVQAVVRFTRTAATGVQNGFRAVAKPVGRAIATTYRQADTAIRTGATMVRNTAVAAGNKAVQLGQSAGRAINAGAAKFTSAFKGLFGS
jgi:hypothetical protein